MGSVQAMSPNMGHRGHVQKGHYRRVCVEAGPEAVGSLLGHEQTKRSQTESMSALKKRDCHQYGKDDFYFHPK